MDKAFLAIFNACVLFYSLWFVHGLPSCSETPFVQVCNDFIGQSLPLQTQHQTPFVFRDHSLLVTMNHANQAHQMISAMNLSSFDHKAKLAWADCLELYEDTIDHLARSMSSRNPLDSQTWLSAAIANQQTCQNGFLDFNMSSHLESLPYMIMSNLSKLLSNSLAINKAMAYNTKQVAGRRLLTGGFPSWVSSSDRRLLQLSRGAPAAHIIVAQDGSGNYKTISEAVAASIKRRSGTKRFVIYVKKGVYKENVEIKKSMKNLMFIGDGIGATIVTGNKNAQEGSTTFRSATFGIV